MIRLLATIVSYIPGWAIFGQAGVALLIPLVLGYLYKALYLLVGSGRGQSGYGTKTVPRSQTQSAAGAKSGTPASIPFSGNYTTDLLAVKNAIGANSDLHIREFTIANGGGRGALIYVDGMQNDRILNMRIMQFLMYEIPAGPVSSAEIANQLLPFSQLNEADSVESFNKSVLFGHTALLIEGLPGGLLIELPGGANRTIGEPVSEACCAGLDWASLKY